MIESVLSVKNKMSRQRMVKIKWLETHRSFNETLKMLVLRSVTETLAVPKTAACLRFTRRQKDGSRPICARKHLSRWELQSHHELGARAGPGSSNLIKILSYRKRDGQFYLLMLRHQCIKLRTLSFPKTTRTLLRTLTRKRVAMQSMTSAMR